MLKLDLRQKNGDIEHYEQAFVPVSKLIEALKMTPEYFPELDNAGWTEKNAEFMASLFDDKAVTKKAVIEGIASWDFNDICGEINDQLMGVDPKKEMESGSTAEKL
ncbi:phage tail assembly chaperone G [Lacticaseibacillus sp. 53-4]|uniref:phage tail assembly chaperone G n=1 Tax=Lacticaseibacillus sp. 53-4 TaxID=2799575 RepID=UPI001942BFD1|nr:hypothetical protein [Lacticaseibacillus sp. 53-4]